MYTCPPIKRICINFQQNRCLCEHMYIYCYSRTYSFLYTNNTDIEIQCAVQRLRIYATKKLLGVPSNDFCLYGVKSYCEHVHIPTKQNKNAPVSTLGNANTVLSPMTHSLLHKSRLPKPHTNSTIISSFPSTGTPTSPGFNYQTQHVTGNNVIHIDNSGHNLPYNTSRSKRSSVCLHEQNSDVTSLLNEISSC
jgi:hypothetical protein